MDYHADDAGAAGAGAEVHAGTPDFVLQQLIQLPAQHFHQLGHLDIKKINKSHIKSRKLLSWVRGPLIRLRPSWILVFTSLAQSTKNVQRGDNLKLLVVTETVEVTIGWITVVLRTRKKSCD